MDIESIKWWQWAIVGGLAGLAVGWAVLAQRQYRRVGGTGFISQGTFEQELSLPPADGKPRLKNFLIYPVGTVDVIEMEHLGPLPGSKSTTYFHWMFAAPHPYKPRHSVKSVGTTYTVRDYIQDVARDGQIAIEFAWWREPPAVLAAWTAGGMILVGGLWPILLRWLAGDGLSLRVPATAPYVLDRFTRAPEPAPTPAPPDKSREQLAKLEEEMLRSLEEQAPSSSSAAAAPPPPPASAPVELGAGPLQALDAPPPDDKHYKGTYYPVAHPESPPELPPSGFALVELLVVLGIITVLISLLLPAVRSASQSAQQVQCATQLRQIYAALSMYSNANQGWLPAWSAYHTWPRKLQGDTAGPAWSEELIPYLGSPDGPIYNCPSFSDSERFRNYFLAARWSGRSGRNAMKLTDIRMTGRFVLSGDKSQRALYPPPFGTNSSHPLDDADPDDFGQSGTPCLAWPWQDGGFWMHRHGNNVLFDDGHVALFGAYDPTAMTFHPKKMQDWADVTPGD